MEREREENERVEVKDGGSGGGWNRVEDGEERRAEEWRKAKEKAE